MLLHIKPFVYMFLHIPNYRLLFPLPYFTPHPNTIILSVEEYERIYELQELLEHIQIYKTVEQRKKTPLNEYIDLDQ